MDEVISLQIAAMCAMCGRYVLFRFKMDSRTRSFDLAPDESLQGLYASPWHEPLVYLFTVP